MIYELLHLRVKSVVLNEILNPAPVKRHQRLKRKELSNYHGRDDPYSQHTLAHRRLDDSLAHFNRF
jgi:hypothetical protein